MKTTLTVNITPRIKSKLDQISKKEHIDKSEIVKDALKQYFAIIDFHEIRQKMLPKAQAVGVFTDEDVFKLVS